MPRRVVLIISAIILISIVLILTVGSDDVTLSRQSLMADVEQFASTVESVHANPYHRFANREEWRSCVNEVIRGIPESGMTRDEFYWHLCPLVTSLGDAHTWLRSPGKFEYGLPLYLSVVADGMFIAGVPTEEHQDLLGARLIGIQGVSIEEIKDRARPFVSAENDYQVWRNLSGTGMLFNRYYLQRLIPECEGHEEIDVSVKKTDGTFSTETLKLSRYDGLGSYEWIDTDFTLPLTERSDFVYDFIDSSKQTALIVINDLNTYREAFEMWQRAGRFNDCADEALELFRRYNSSDPPGHDSVLIAGLPSATEMFISMCEEMKEAGTRSLIVDLRRCDGGNSAMAEILTYCLYGKEKLLAIEAKQIEVLRCSPTYLERNPGVNLDEIAYLPGVIVDSGEYRFQIPDLNEYSSSEEAVRKRFEDWAKSMSTFYSEYTSGASSLLCLPMNVYVLTSANTFSSGFTVMYYLYQAGAKVVGVPSAQAANCFGETLDFQLDNSELSFTVTCKYYGKFPTDSGLGRVLIPDYPLTYEVLSEYGFDLNASLLYALDLVN